MICKEARSTDCQQVLTVDSGAHSNCRSDLMLSLTARRHVSSVGDAVAVTKERVDHELLLCTMHRQLLAQRQSGWQS